ncbi:MAG: hypothetical protein EZS28_002737 [Streblomastix strix]|uniref:Uncharacterized protein n=1 Tax=Streblomastix strix TaxID=222440 RepID=A0A5J4X3E1_9EUKA|nr:MAG: hypothetical protein EZS28_002737 [Streblomastix strix]
MGFAWIGIEWIKIGRKSILELIVSTCAESPDTCELFAREGIIAKIIQIHNDKKSDDQTKDLCSLILETLNRTKVQKQQSGKNSIISKLEELTKSPSQVISNAAQTELTKLTDQEIDKEGVKFVKLEDLIECDQVMEEFGQKLIKLGKKQKVILIEDIANKDEIIKEIEEKKKGHIDEKCKLIRDLAYLTLYGIPESQKKLKNFFNEQIDHILDLGQSSADFHFNYGDDNVCIPNDRKQRGQIIAAHIWRYCFTSDGEGVVKLNQYKITSTDVSYPAEIFMGNTELDLTMQRILFKTLKNTDFSCYTEYDWVKSEDY